MVSLIPNLTASFVKNDMDDVRKKINLTIQSLLFFTLPMTFGLSILAKPVWNIFYGVSEFGPNVYQYYVFVALATTLFTSSVTMLQLLKEYKRVFLGLVCGLLTNALLNIPFLYGFHKMGLPAYYGSITSTILGYLVCSFMSLRYIGKKYNVNYEDTVKKVIHIVFVTLMMVLSLLVLKLLVPLTTTSRILSILLVILYAIVGGVVYFVLMFKSGIIYEIFGKENVNKILKKIRKR